MDGVSVPCLNSCLDMLLLRTALESGTGHREGQLPSAAHSHQLAEPAWPLGLWNGGTHALSLYWPKSVKHPEVCFLLGRQGNVLGGQSRGQHCLCLPGCHPFRAFRLKQNATQSLSQTSLSSASATSELRDLGYLYCEDSQIVCFAGCHNDQRRKCK